MTPELVEEVRSHLAAAGEGAMASGVATTPQVRAAVAGALRAAGVEAGGTAFAALVREVADEVAGLGPIEALLRLPGVTDVMVNGPDEVWVEQHGRLRRADVAFADDEAVLSAVRRVVTPHGGRIDRARPFVDAHLPDGTRVHAVGPPISPDGTLVTLRRFDTQLLDWSALTADGAVPADVAGMLRAAVADRRAVVVCGRTGSGKTTMLQRLVSDVGADERVVVIEDSPELRPRTPHLVRLQARAATAEGVGEHRIADLVRQALRMRPDRIVVGEVRGVEVADVLQALITGHEGCMTSVHAADAAQALVRLEGMALLADIPLEAARAQVGSAVDLVVAMGRAPDGQRGVTEVAEVVLEGDRPVARSCWRRDGWPRDGWRRGSRQDALRDGPAVAR